MKRTIIKSILGSATLFLVLSFAHSSLAQVTEGQVIFTQSNCVSCHQVRGPATEETIKEVYEKKGPELWYAGSKFAPGFLEEWLARPKPIRPMAYYSLTEENKGDHPVLSKEEAFKVSAYLMTLKSPEVKPTGLVPGRNIKGKKVFGKEFSCYGCHRIRARSGIIGGLSGPELVGIPSRLNPDWVYAYLTKPKVFKPVKSMPVYSGLVSPEKMRHLAEYVSGLE